MKATLQNLTSQLNKLELEHKAQTQEADMLRAEVTESKADTLTVREELISEHAREISPILF